MNSVLATMITLYNPENIDWMGYKLTKKNPYTYHHIIKKEHRGAKTVENGAIITHNPHEYLHLIERIEPEMYDMINIVLEQINIQQHQPIYRQYMAINAILEEFESKHGEDINSKGNPLIKSVYYNRKYRR